MEHEYQVAGAVNPNLSWLKGNCLLTHTEKFRDLWVQEYECIG